MVFDNHGRMLDDPGRGAAQDLAGLAGEGLGATVAGLSGGPCPYWKTIVYSRCA